MDKPQKKKDAWDKAQIVSGFMASVVIAGVGILINISIQRAQIAASKSSAEAQIEVTERNNKAQLDLTRQTAEIQRHLQEGTLTGQLVEHLVSGSTLKKQLAIVVLRRSTPPDMYQDVITIVVKSDGDPEVRKTALEQARMLRDVAPTVAQAIAQVAEDSSRPPEERELATDTIRQIGLVSTAPTNTFVFSSSASTHYSVESDLLRSSAFTHYLLRGLSGEASVKRDGNVRLSELADFVISRVKSHTRLAQIPMFTAPINSSDPLIVGPGAKYSKIVSVVVGNTEYRDPNLALRFAADDARSFAKFWQHQGEQSNTILLVNSTKAQMQQALQQTTQQVDGDSLEIFYYSGHALADSDGTSWLVPVDFDVERFPETSISPTEIRNILSRSPARVQVLFIDAAFGGAKMAIR
jgi:caspase domain-containing protein